MRYVWWGGTSFVCICPVNILENWAFLYAIEYPGIPGVQLLGFAKISWYTRRTILRFCYNILVYLENNQVCLNILVTWGTIWFCLNIFVYLEYYSGFVHIIKCTRSTLRFCSNILVYLEYN